MDRFELFTAMVSRKPINLGGYMVLVNKIECEDGSGYSFNVTGQIVGYSQSGTFYVRFVKSGVCVSKLVKTSAIYG